MKTGFTARQLSAPHIAEVDEILRRCTNCGLCTATCPTYLVTGDERDGPRGRITMIREMFERDAAAPQQVAYHLDRCIGCLACETTCPSSVDYRHLLGHARAHLRKSETRTARDRAVRWFLTRIAPYPKRLRWALRSAPFARRFGWLLRHLQLERAAATIDALPPGAGRSARFTGPGTAATNRQRTARVILLAGCTQQVLRPDINDATIRLLARRGTDVEVAAGAGCCGAIIHQLGNEARAAEFARLNVDAWWKLIQREPVDAIVTNTASCGTMLKDYAHLLRHDPDYAERAGEIAARTQDVSEFIAQQDLGPPRRWSSLKIGYLAACTLVHGQRVKDAPSELLRDAGFTVVPLPEQEICCGASGAYAITQPELAGRLRQRKVEQIDAVRPDVIAAGNVACIMHLQGEVAPPLCHTVELLDWAYGGPVPRGLEHLKDYMTDVPGPPPLELEDYVRV